MSRKCSAATAAMLSLLALVSAARCARDAEPPNPAEPPSPLFVPVEVFGCGEVAPPAARAEGETIYPSADPDEGCELCGWVVRTPCHWTVYGPENPLQVRVWREKAITAVFESEGACGESWYQGFR